MINEREHKQFRLFEQNHFSKSIDRNNKHNNNNKQEAQKNSPVKSKSFLRLPSVSPNKNNTLKKKYNNLNLSALVEETKLSSPIIDIKHNNLSYSLFMKQNANYLLKKKSGKISLRKVNHTNILPTFNANNKYRYHRSHLNLSSVNNQTTSSSPLVNEFKSFKKKSVPSKINTSTINLIDTFNVKPKVIKYGYQSKGGETVNGLTKGNQDSFLIMSQNYKGKKSNGSNSDNQIYIYGVFDGHGENGKFVSQTVKKAIEAYFTKEIKYFNTEFNNTYDETLLYHLTKNDYAIIAQAFEVASDALRKNKVNSMFSGTTCVLVFIINEVVICANTGDSRAVLYCDKKSPVALSIDHKPHIKEEFERIIQSGGEVSKMSQNGIGPYRVWVKDQKYPGLAMSRSIGDFVAEEIGVISIPEVIEREINANDCQYIVIGSDGLWEWLSLEEVNAIVLPFYKQNNVGKATNLLLDTARKKWSKLSNIIDDITVIVIFFGK